MFLMLFLYRDKFELGEIARSLLNEFDKLLYSSKTRILWLFIGTTIGEVGNSYFLFTISR